MAEETPVLVLAHNHDADAKVYRLTIGYRLAEERPMLDEQGQALFAEYEEVEQPNGETLRMPVGEPMTERVEHDVPVEDFVWADGDERWEGLSAEEVAAEQVGEIRELLEQRRRDEEEREAATEAARTDLPSVGQAL